MGFLEKIKLVNEGKLSQKQFNNYMKDIEEEGERDENFFKEMKKEAKKTVERKTGNILKGKSDLKKKGDKYTVDTELKIKKGLDAKTKRALKKSVVEELDKRMEGGKMRTTAGKEFSNNNKARRKREEEMEAKELATLSFMERAGAFDRPPEMDDLLEKLHPVPRADMEHVLSQVEKNIDDKELLPAFYKETIKRIENQMGLNKEGKGLRNKPEIILSSDSEDERKPKRGGKLKPVNTLKDVLKHLLEHINDINGEYDEDDYKQSKEIIDLLKGIKKNKKKTTHKSSLNQYLENIEKKKDEARTKKSDEMMVKVDRFLNMF